MRSRKPAVFAAKEVAGFRQHLLACQDHDLRVRLTATTDSFRKIETFSQVT
jgi:hypothetical protein